jgi:hypothetical protein
VTPEDYYFTDPDDDGLDASVLSGHPVVELVTETPGVWLSADDAEALAAWLIEAAKALRERSGP